MPYRKPESEVDLWETDLGLPDDIDGWITNPRFGVREEYGRAIQAVGAEAVQFLCDLENGEGEIIAGIGYSCGGGWQIHKDGESISHPLKSRIVKTSIYGQFMDMVTKTLKVDMRPLGSPLTAETWSGLGFHWKQVPHATVGETSRGTKEATALMPVDYLGPKEKTTAKSKSASTPRSSREEGSKESGLRAKLAAMASVMELKAFCKAAQGIDEVIEDDDLLSEVTDQSEGGFWATHR